MDCYYNSWSKGCNCKCDVKDVIILKGATLNLPKTSTAPASQHVAVILLLLRSQFRMGKPLPLPPLPHFCSSTLRCSHAPTHPRTHTHRERANPGLPLRLHGRYKQCTASPRATLQPSNAHSPAPVHHRLPAYVRRSPPQPPSPMTGGPLVLYSVMQLVLWGPLFFSR